MSAAAPYRTIQLTRGYVALVDEQDYEPLMKYKWTAHVAPRKDRVSVYARRCILANGKSSTVWMHKEILPGHANVDHRDNDGLNNRRYNLRPATKSQNGANAVKGRGRSQFKGVSLQSGRSKWTAQIFKDGQHYFIGSFKDEVDAATAYNFKAFELYGEYARLNTPLEAK